MGISVDTVDVLKRFKEKTKAQYPLLSDAGGKVARQYVGVVPLIHLAKRANVVVGEDGIVKEIVTGQDAVDPSSAIAACPVHGVHP